MTTPAQLPTQWEEIQLDHPDDGVDFYIKLLSCVIPGFEGHKLVVLQPTDVDGCWGIYQLGPSLPSDALVEYIDGIIASHRHR